MRIENQRSRYKKSMSYPKFSVGYLPYPMSLFNQAKRLCFMREAEDPGQRPSGMTPNLMGFTLIELLVVVLIIGILAAVALPKYEMAVWKARFSTLKSTVNTFAQAEEAYYMANGTYTVDADELSVSFSGITSSSVNDTSGTYYYPWGRCNLYHQAEVGSHVECVLNKNEEAFLSYARYFQNAPAAHGKQYCGAFNSSSASDVQQRICKSESGLSTPTSGDGITYGGYAW